MWRRRTAPKDESERDIEDVAKARERTMNRAVKLLAAKPRSIGELRERLLEKAWTNSEIVNSVIEKLEELVTVISRRGIDFAEFLAKRDHHGRLPLYRIIVEGEEKFFHSAQDRDEFLRAFDTLRTGVTS